MKKIGLLMVGLLVFGQAELTRTDEGVVKDSDTKLEWQDNYENNNIKVAGFNGAISYCENLELDNKDDWRLPNINEFKSIVVETQYAPTIATGENKFQYTASSNNDYYYSSTDRVASSGYKYMISFNNGSITFVYPNQAFFVRCVRDAEN